MIEKANIKTIKQSYSKIIKKSNTPVVQIKITHKSYNSLNQLTNPYDSLH